VPFPTYIVASDSTVGEYFVGCIPDQTVIIAIRHHIETDSKFWRSIDDGTYATASLLPLSFFDSVT
jgi:hypothetical protein